MSSYQVIAEDCFGFRTRPLQDFEAIARLRDARLRRVVGHAWRTVPYYKRLFAEARLDPRDIRGIRDLPLIPMATKEALQSTPLEQRLTEGARRDRLVRNATSGSTGMPMIVLRTRIEEALVHGYQLRSQLFCGIPLRARRARVGKPSRPGLVHRLGLLPLTDVDAIRQTADSMLKQLRQSRPACIDVRPGVLELMVEAAERDGRVDWPWRWMLCGGEVLYPDLRMRSERVFGARVLERYGAHEVGQIAWRCPDCGYMHTNDDSVVVEVEKEGKPVGPGETGEILVTGLLSFAMPFLRLRLGDVVEQGPGRENQCRFAFGQIRAVQGRQIDNLMMADGRFVPTYGLMTTVRQMSGVRRFQIIQESFEGIRIRYVPDPGVVPDIGLELERRLREALPVPMTVIAEPVTQILPDGSGKYRYVQAFSPASLPSSHIPR